MHPAAEHESRPTRPDQATAEHPAREPLPEVDTDYERLALIVTTLQRTHGQPPEPPADFFPEAMRRLRDRVAAEPPQPDLPLLAVKSLRWASVICLVGGLVAAAVGPLQPAVWCWLGSVVCYGSAAHLRRSL
ncbi:MAG: hypothetical protein HZB16_24790 [Armatimonadetes bacterium]|nr:hypothetical protein [Armatimonadota bacterium]